MNDNNDNRNEDKNRKHSSLAMPMASISMTLFALTIITGIASTNTMYASADDTTTTDQISVNVKAACTMAATDNTHSAEVTPGQWTDNIGLTNITTTCNDPNGYAIYAVGYTNNEIGNTNLINTTDNTKTIATGPNKSGNTSGWSMKLGKGTGDSATIMGETSGDPEDFYNDYHIVPSAYTKVAEKTNATSSTITGTAFTTTYGVFTTSSQTAGTYEAQVKYILVHPHTAPAPFVPHEIDCDPGNICYQPNADSNETPDTMGDQGITNTATSADLWASNFKRDGYGFAGWNTEPDYSGTSYGPNETITFTAGQYSGSNPGLSLYAIWIPSAGDLQSWTGCSSLTKANEVANPADILTQSLTALTDTRDSNTYAVAKLADGNCWMIENLRLDNQYTTGSTNEAKAQGYAKYSGTGTNYGDFIGLAEPENTLNWSSSSTYTTANSIYYSGTQSGTATIDIGTTSYPYYRFPRYNNQNIAFPATNMTAWDNNSNTYSVGNWYTWAAAIADTSHYSTNNQSVTGTSICPSGWSLPKGGDKNNTTNSDFWQLGVAIVGAEPTNTSSETRPYYTGSTEGANASKAFRSYPANFIYSGYFSGGSPSNRGSRGNYWSSTVFGGTISYYLSLGSSDVYPGTLSYTKYSGLSIRCLVGS